MDIIVSESIVYVFFYLGYLEEVAILEGSGCMYKEIEMII